MKKNMQEMNLENGQKKVCLPEGACRWGYCCADCVYMNLSDTNGYGECWCAHLSRYNSPADSNVCYGYFKER